MEKNFFKYFAVVAILVNITFLHNKIYDNTKKNKLIFLIVLVM